MLNGVVAKILSDTADFLELKGENPFRIRAFRRAVQTVEGLSSDLSALTRPERLELPGIGKGVADLIDEVSATGRFGELEALKRSYPVGLLDVMRVPNVGPKRAAALHHELGIDSIPKLQKAIDRGAIQHLKGFGETLEEKIRQGLKTASEGLKRLIVTDALVIAERVRSHLKAEPGIERLELAGSARRWKETVGDLDFLCTSRRPDAAIKRFLSYPGITSVLAAGTTKASAIIDGGLQCDFRVVAPASFGAALVYFTGSKDHNVRLRERAVKRGLSLNEYGLFRADDAEMKRPLAGKTEEEVYRALGLDWIPPELREDRGEIDAAEKKQLPRLVEMSDVKGDLHNHTTLSDGANSLAEMVEAARKRGWSWFVSADHSPSLTIASGLPVATLRRKIKDVRALDRASKKMRVLVGTEVDILADGKIDYSDAVLKELDCVVASVHSRFSQTEAEMTERILRAVRHPEVNVIGHLTGRRIHKREGYRVDVGAVLEAARQSQTAIEINGQPERQELADVHVKRAVELGVPLVLSTDAHSTVELGHMTLALHIARRGWAEARHLINSFSSEEVHRWLSA